MEVQPSHQAKNKLRVVLQLRENVEQYTGPSTAHVTFGPRPRRPGRGAGEGAGHEAEAGRGWPGLLRGRWRRDDRESLVCYALYAGVFVADMSLLALAFPAALYLYALLVNPPSPRFWQARALSMLPCLVDFISFIFYMFILKSQRWRPGVHCRSPAALCLWTWTVVTWQDAPVGTQRTSRRGARVLLCG